MVHLDLTEDEADALYLRVESEFLAQYQHRLSTPYLRACVKLLHAMAQTHDAKSKAHREMLEGLAARQAEDENGPYPNREHRQSRPI